MCGFAGYWTLKGQKASTELVSAMASTLNHRGPDDQGIYTHEGLALGHARLSIHDLSHAGHQPMLSASKRWVIAFNGEIYNYGEIKKQLLKDYPIHFTSNSDTEVLINAIELWGIEKALKESIGMFAFAAFDLSNNELYLARDRFGEKPLYYGSSKGLTYFASELKALKPLKQLGVSFEVDRDSLASYMRFGYVPTPYSIYQGIHKLEPGSILKIDAQGQQTLNYYWQASGVLSQSPFSGSYEQAVDLLENQLIDTLKLQMQADVPLGAFLSGGIDSSTIVALMQSLSSQKINTFSIGFHEAAFNEAVHAKDIAKHIGTEHTELYLTQKDMLDVIPSLPGMYDEPFADSSQIPTYLVSKLARSKVTVSLSGDAGDELFGGYNRYALAESLYTKFIKPGHFGPILKSLPTSWLKLLGRLPSRHALLSDKLLKLKAIIENCNGSKEDLYLKTCSQLYDTSLVLNSHEQARRDQWIWTNETPLSYQEKMMLADSQTYMMDDILTKVDRAAMAVSLETRVPFLDHRIFKLAWQLPLSFKIDGHNRKRILRDVLYRHVPKSLMDRPKMGFGVPLAQWLREDLRPWTEELLDPTTIRKQGYLNEKIVSNYWKEHMSGKRNWAYALWNILMFQAWAKPKD